MSQIFNSFKIALLSLEFKKCLLESIFQFDFKIGNQRGSLMRLCFSSLAQWPFFLGILVIAIDPFKKDWSLFSFLGEDSPVFLFLLDGHLDRMLMVFILFFVIEWIFRKENYIILFALYFLNRSNVHLNLTLALVMGTVFARICYMWWAITDIQSETKKIWNRLQQLQMLSWVLSAGLFLYLLDFVQVNHLLNQTGQGYFTRLNFMALFLGSLYFGNFLLMSVWGHFYFKAKKDPSFIPLHYSTAHWILRFKLSGAFVKTFKKEVEEQTEKHKLNIAKFSELKKVSPGLAHFSLGAIMEKELELLKEALLRLSRI